MADLHITRRAGEVFELHIAGHHHPIVISIDGINRQSAYRDRVLLTVSMTKSVKLCDADPMEPRALAERSRTHHKIDWERRQREKSR